MKNKISLSILAVSLIAASQSVFAAGGRTVDATITKVFATNSGDTLITLTSEQLTNGSACAGTAAGATFKIAASAGNAKSGLATVLTARALDATVQFDIGECDGIPYPEISNVILK